MSIENGKLTRDELRAHIRGLGMSVIEYQGEIRVNFKGGRESTAYYTNDRADALATARDMMRRRQSASAALTNIAAELKGRDLSD
jgi:hypothetical protein